jgi:endogenous inhibitor of DNA gyrase (YacG/DUF329 family)
MDDGTPTPKRRPCAVCGKPAQPRFRPFCSARCKTIDLGRWLGGHYAVPSEEPPEEDESSDAHR